MTSKELFTLIGLNKTNYDYYRFYNITNGYRMIFYGIKNLNNSLDAIKTNLQFHEHYIEFKDSKMIITIFTSIQYALKDFQDSYHSKISKIAYFLWLENPNNPPEENWKLAEESYRHNNNPKYT